MFQVFRKELSWGGRRLVLETGKMARQADGAVLATYGETTVLCTAVAMKAAKPGQDFFPLTVNYQEKTFAAGKIPGGFFKREGRPSEKETLTSRLIDRPIRPLFVPGFRNETQVVCTVLSHDLENDPDVLALIGSSAALTISGIPFMGPIAGCRVGYIDGQYVLNPTLDQLPQSQNKSGAETRYSEESPPPRYAWRRIAESHMWSGLGSLLPLRTRTRLRRSSIRRTSPRPTGAPEKER